MAAVENFSLNHEQQAAVEFFTGAGLVIAGAGSGKTRVIIARILYLIKHCNVNPGSIVVLTFTNKAAKEMKERLHKVWLEQDHATSRPFMGTFHAYCLQLLFHNRAAFGLEQFSVMDTDDQLALLKKILTSHGLSKEFVPKKLLGIISGAKNQVDLSVEQWFTNQGRAGKQLHDIYSAYEQEKRLAHSLDFDDILMVVYNKLRRDPEFCQRLTERVLHLMVDEYQDTNHLQYYLLKLLATPVAGNVQPRSIFAVGDEDQAIYSWRGAVVENMAKFCKEFNAKVFKITQNYRSSQPILDAANRLILNNKSPHPKNLWSQRPAKSRLLHLWCKNDWQEADLITQAVVNIQQKYPQQSVAILYRNHHQTRLIEEGLISRQLQYQIIGGIKFYERKEIKDVIAYLKLLCNPWDYFSLQRIFNVPQRGLGDKALSVLEELHSSNPNYNCLELLEAYHQNSKAGSQASNVAKLLKILSNSLAQKEPTEALAFILEGTDYPEYLRKSYEKAEAEERLKNLEELHRAMARFEGSGDGSTDRHLVHFLQEVALWQEAESQAKNTGNLPVQLMTLHSAKGLEFDNVIIAGLEDGGLPSLRSQFDSNNSSYLAEERRLFYVGITRARERLLFTGAYQKMEYGALQEKDPSRFIHEIRPALDFSSKEMVEPAKGRVLLQQWLAEQLTPGKIDESPSFKSSPASGKANSWNIAYSSVAKHPAHGSPIHSATLTNKPLPRAEKAVEVSTKTQVGSQSNRWKLYQPVKHAVFGMGIIQAVEPMEGGEPLVTVSFSGKSKKINGKFLTVL